MVEQGKTDMTPDPCKVVEPLSDKEIEELRVFLEHRQRWRWLRNTIKTFCLSSLAIVGAALVFDQAYTAAAKRIEEWLK